MDAHRVHEESVEPAFQIVVEVARRRVERQSNCEGPSTDQVDGILRASPALIELKLQEFSPYGDDVLPIKQTHPIELLSLKKFTINHLTPELTTHLLRNVRIPNCENIVIHMSTSTKASYSTIESLFRSARAITEASGSGKVELGAAQLDLKCWKQNKVVLEVCIMGKGWDSNAAKNILQQLDETLDLDVSIDMKLHDQSDLTKILDLVPSLRGPRVLRLGQHLPSTHDGSNALIGKLGAATIVDGILRWPLSHLEKLK
ncbi:hypothetical protein FRB97_006657, partial [Tulasnella sp. 331]